MDSAAMTELRRFPEPQPLGSKVITLETPPLSEETKAELKRIDDNIAAAHRTASTFYLD